MKVTYRSKINDLGVVLFMGSSGCIYSKKIRRLLEKSSKKFYYFESIKIGEKFIKNIKKNPDFIENQIFKNKNIKWSNKIKKLKDLNSFYEINKNIKKNDFLNKIRATDTPKFKPYIKFYGKKFILE